MQYEKIVAMFVVFVTTVFTLTPVLAEDSTSADGSSSFAEGSSFADGSQNLSAYIDDDSKMVLDDLIVYGYKNGDQNNDSVADVLVTKIWKSLGAGEGVAVNVDFPFAPNSSVLTADGNELMGLLARAIKFLGKEILFEVQIPNDSKNKLSKARVSSIVAEFNSRYRLNNAFTLNTYSNNNSAPVNVQNKNSKDSKGKWSISRPEIWRATIVNRGRITNNLELVSQLPNVSFPELLTKAELAQSVIAQ